MPITRDLKVREVVYTAEVAVEGCPIVAKIAGNYVELRNDAGSRSLLTIPQHQWVAFAQLVADVSQAIAEKAEVEASPLPLPWERTPDALVAAAPGGEDDALSAPVLAPGHPEGPVVPLVDLDAALAEDEPGSASASRIGGPERGGADAYPVSVEQWRGGVSG